MGGGGDGIWSTWEELLLASAVCRHGTSRWKAVAMEVGNRCSRTHHLFTPERCRQRYRELRQRFEGAVPDGGGQEGDDEGEPGEACGGEGGAAAAVPWLEELRRLRVDELRREVERYDASIGSLQLKVKKLTEERERSIREEGSSSGGDGDPDKNVDTTNKPGSSSTSPPDGGSTQPPCGVVEQAAAAAAGGGKRGPEFPDEPEARGRDDRAGGVSPGDGEKHDGVAGEEGSFDGSSDTVSKGDRPQPASGGSPCPDTADGAAPAASGDAAPMTMNGRCVDPEPPAAKEISDVQSSASPSRNRRPMAATEEASATASASASASRAGSSGCDEAEADDESPLRPRGTATTNKSPPLAALLETVQSSKYGLVFERRLPVQEGARYQSIIRQHIDLKTIQRRVQEASYSRLELQRDLLLLCNNAVVFFPKGSEEHSAAVHLRCLINKKFASSSGDGKPSPIHPKASTSAAVVRQPMQLPKVKTEETTSSSLLEKPGLLPSLIACKKRSSITSKAAAATPEEKGEEKPTVVGKVTEGVGIKVEEKPVVRGLRTTKARGAPAKTANQKLIKAAACFGAKPIPADNAMESPKAERKSDADSTASESPVSVSAAAQIPPAAKKKGAAVFLKRMKAPESASSQKRADPEQKKVGKVDERKEKGPRQGEVAKVAPDPSPPVKRKGRPPKRPAAASPPQPPPAKKGRPPDAEVSLTPPPPRPRGSTAGKREKR